MEVLLNTAIFVKIFCMKFIVSCTALLLSFNSWGQTNQMNYSLDLTQSQDTFLVSLSFAEKLQKDQDIFQFAATAPGTYQTMNIGRLVSDFKAYDKKGKEITTIFTAPNQYQLTKPQKISKITYRVAETFDTPLKEFPIYLMCGSSIEEDHTLINAHTVMGYIHGLQKIPFNVSITHDEAWKIGTALQSENGTYRATDFDHLVDSPILLGDLTFADTTIAGSAVEIFTYSKSGKITSQLLLDNMSDMLDASRKFLVELPVDRYTFLYFFEPNLNGQTGAWEHSYSSEYVLNEKEPSPDYMSKVTDIASHEFFHIVTPLNIHSEVIETFNFVNPTPSIHLWLYEGVTEWASNILLYRGELVDLETYLGNSVAQKIYVDNNYFNKEWSLKKLAQESFTEKGSKQYGNIYYRGSLIAGLLDILLLDKSDGTYGLRELMLDLIKKYGKGNPFSEETFIEDLTNMTYPEIDDFFKNYVMDNQALPYKDYLDKIGLQLIDSGGKISIRKRNKLSDRQKHLFDAWSKNLPLD